MTRVIQRTIEVTVTPEEAGDVFSEWGSDEQALFLNTAAEQFYGWSGTHGAESQALQIAGRLTEKAKNLIAAVHYFAEQRPPQAPPQKGNP